MERFVLTDAQWAKMEPHCLVKPGDPGRTGMEGRLFLEAVLWIARTSRPWPDLPSAFGKGNTGIERSRERAEADVFGTMLAAESDEPDLECAMRHHRQGSPPRAGRKRGTESQAMGKSRGGWTTKILALTDALGTRVRFTRLPGQ